MNLQDENTTDAAQEKHVPVVEKENGRIAVKVGEVAHPMQDNHWIEWIELLADGRSHRQWLSPSDAPEAVFAVDADQFTVRAFCNLHGLWKSG
jgi:superoxide reductase